MQYETFNLFPKIIFIHNLKFNKNIMKKIDKINFRKIATSSRSESNYILENKIFKDLKEKIMKQFYIYAHDILKYKNNKFKITTSWFTKTLEGEDSVMHNHRNCMFSGVLYLKGEDNKIKIQFWNPYTANFYVAPTEYNLLNSEHQMFKFPKNTLIFFPSEMYHKIETYKSKQERISLAFNIIPIGKFGVEDSTLEI
jgi:uncharacterized protein (TIGR02466 family)